MRNNPHRQPIDSTTDFINGAGADWRSSSGAEQTVAYCKKTQWRFIARRRKRRREHYARREAVRNRLRCHKRKKDLVWVHVVKSWWDDDSATEPEHYGTDPGLCEVYAPPEEMQTEEEDVVIEVDTQKDYEELNVASPVPPQEPR